MPSEDPTSQPMNELAAPSWNSTLQSEISGVVLQLADGTIQACNATAQTILGLTAAELQEWYGSGVPWRAIHPDGSLFPGEAHPTRVTLATGQPCVNVVMGVYTPHDQLIWLLINTTPLLKLDSTPYGVVTVFNDITVTESTPMASALREQEERWQLALRGNNDGVWDWNVQTNAVFFSTRWKTMLGYGEDEISNHLDEWVKRVHPDDLEAAMQAVQDHFDQKTPFYISEHRVQCKDGTYKWILDRGQALWDEAGNVRRMVGSHTDVTERRELEAALQRANQELERRVAERTAQLERANAALWESEDRNQLAMDVARMFTFEWEPGTDIVKRSPQCAAILGLTDAAIEQDTGANYFQRIYAADRDRFVAGLQALTPADSTYKTTYRVVRPDGQIVVLEENARALFDQQGQLIRLIGMTVDVTERQRLEAALEESRATLQRQLAEIETIYQSAPIGLNVLDTELRFVRINQQLAEINGFSVTEHIGKTIRELLPDLADAAEQTLRLILVTGEPLLNVELRGETPAQPGVKRVWRESFLPLKDGDRVIGINTVCEEITERKKTEEALRQFKLLIELSYEPLFVWSLEAGIITWNQGCEQLYGYTHEEAIGQPSHVLLQTIYPVDRVEFLALLERDHQWSGELRHTTRTGRQVIVESRQQVIETDGRRLILETNHDITERKRAEQRLRDSEALLRLGMQVTGFAMAKIDYVTNRVDLSPETAVLFGLPPDELVVSREQIHATFHPEDCAELSMRIQQALDPTGTGWFAHDHRVLWKNGGVRWLSVRKQVFFDRSRESPKPTYAVLVALDITDRKQVEESLRESEDRLRMAIASAQLGIWDWNMKTGELKWDAGCKAMFGLPPDAASSIEVFFAGLHPDDRDQLREIVQTALNPESGGDYDVEFRTVGIQDRVERWLRSKGQVYFDPNGQPLRFSGVVLNVTARKHAEAQREQLLEQEQAAREAAERANRMKDEFLAVLSHELRTPLNPILGWAKLLQMPQVSAEKLQQGLTTIERNAKQQAQLIDDLLDTSRIIRGKIALNFAAIAPSQPILAALETVRLATEAKAIQFQVSLDPMIGSIRGDAGRLQQVIWNLLSNAIKFTPMGGQVSVTLSSVTDDLASVTEQQALVADPEAAIERVTQYAQITVTDTGKGIQPEFLPHVFELFRQQDSSTTRSFGGLGLGLAIARQVVEAHGGTITADSAGEGQGATFTVRLPLIPQLHANSATDRSDQTPSFKNLRVIVVDDEGDSLDLAKFVLEHEGAVVQAVSTATEALRLLSQGQFDLLISDIGMPQMDGYAFIRQVRMLPPRCNRAIPAIALTAYAGETNRQQILAAGFQAHLEKPLEPQQLLSAIAAIIRP